MCTYVEVILIDDINRDCDRNNSMVEMRNVAGGGAILNAKEREKRWVGRDGKREDLKTSSSRKEEVALLATLNHTSQHKDITCNSSTRVDRLSIAASHFPVSRPNPANGRRVGGLREIELEVGNIVRATVKQKDFDITVKRYVSFELDILLFER